MVRLLELCGGETVGITCPQGVVGGETVGITCPQRVVGGETVGTVWW